MLMEHMYVFCGRFFNSDARGWGIINVNLGKSGYDTEEMKNRFKDLIYHSLKL